MSPDLTLGGPVVPEGHWPVRHVVNVAVAEDDRLVAMYEIKDRQLVEQTPVDFAALDLWERRDLQALLSAKIDVARRPVDAAGRSSPLFAAAVEERA